MNELQHLDLPSPVGIIEIAGDAESIHSILFTDRSEPEHLLAAETPEPLKQCARQLKEYFKGERTEFDLPLHSIGTSFQQQVWQALMEVEYAKTASYKDIAVSIGRDKAVRAVGSANSKNKLTIVVPCHRIIGSNGTLTGYAGTLERKEWLLAHEQAVRERQANLTETISQS
jgi:methylated-DNA-[protein]-cysteine S-methyltransferase